MNRNGNKNNWRIRRRFMFTVTAFCMVVISFVLVRGLDTGPADTAVTMGFLALIGIVGSYVFGATWEDIRTIQVSSGTRKVNRPWPDERPFPPEDFGPEEK